MSTTKTIEDIRKKTEKLLAANEKMLVNAERWTRYSNDVRVVTVNGCDAIRIA